MDDMQGHLETVGRTIVEGAIVEALVKPLTPNPLIRPSIPLRFDLFKPEDATAAVDCLTEECKNSLNQIINTDQPPTIENTLAPLDCLCEKLDLTLSIIQQLNNIDSVNWGKVRAEANKIALDFKHTLCTNDQLFRRLTTLAESELGKSLSGDWKTFLELKLNDLQRNGAGLDPVKKNKLKELQHKLLENCQKFSNNLSKALSNGGVHVLERDRLAGLPDKFIEFAEREATNRSLPGYFLKLDTGNYSTAIKTIDNRAVREELWKCYHSLCCGGDLDNVELANAILNLRGEYAAVLGFENYSSLRLTTLALKTPKEVATFLRKQLSTLLKPPSEGHRNLKEIYPELEPWDVQYLLHKIKLENYQIPKEPIFSLNQVKSEIFKIILEYFKFDFKLKENIVINGSTIELYEIAKENFVVALLYLDCFSHEGKRQYGNWFGTLFSGSLSDGRKSEPRIGLIGLNIANPANDSETTVSISEIGYILHELGHFLQFISDPSDINRLKFEETPWDLIEVASGFTEKLLTVTDLLVRIKNQNGNINLSEFIKTKEQSELAGYSEQLKQKIFRASLDLAAHTHSYPQNSAELRKLESQIYQDITGFSLPEGCSMLTTFDHIFRPNSPYAGCHYTYCLANSIVDGIGQRLADSSDRSAEFERLRALIFDQSFIYYSGKVLQLYRP